MTNLVELKKPTSNPRSTLQDVLGAFVQIEHAASWIAFGTYDRKTTNGPVNLLFLMDDQTGHVAEEYDQHEGRYWLAFEQLRNAITRGKITAYGRYYVPEEGEESDPRADDVLSDGRTRLVKLEETREMFTYLGGEDNCLAIGGHIYDRVAVSWRELVEVFGPLSLEYGDSRLGEKSNEKSKQSIEQIPSSSSTRGRPQKFNWEKLLQEIVILASTSGLPETQAELERWAAEKCEELFGQEPATSSIRSKIAPVYDRLRQKS